MTRRIVGIDIGCKVDRTAVVLLQGAEVRRAMLSPIGTDYPEQIRRLRFMVQDADKVIVDSTGVGLAVFHSLRDVMPEPGRICGITFTAGSEARQKDDVLCVPKLELVMDLHRDIADKALHINLPEPDRSLLLEEMQAFRVVPGKTPRFEAEPGAHDDLVCALAIANYARRRMRRR